MEPELETEPEPKAGCSQLETEQEPDSVEDMSSQLRREICPPKRFTYETLGESSDELIPTTHRPTQAHASLTESVVGDDLDPPLIYDLDTTGWDTDLLLACPKLNVISSSTDVYSLLSEDPLLS